MSHLIIVLTARIIAPFVWFTQWSLRRRFVSAVRSLALARRLEASGPKVSIGSGVRFGRRVEIKIDKGATFTLEDRVLIADDAYLHVFPGATLIIGEGAHINSHVRVSAYERVEIGSESVLAAFSSLHDHHHLFYLKSPYEMGGYEGAPVTLGRGVLVLARVGITEGVTIGDYSVVGANSIVTKSIPSGAFAAGVPAKVLRQVE
jgi:acetyltransferase-like isoleucine patch superfamily enzyme